MSLPHATKQGENANSYDGFSWYPWEQELEQGKTILVVMMDIMKQLHSVLIMQP